MLLLFFLLSNSGALAASLQPTSPRTPLPPLVFEDANGVQHTLSDYKGRFILLNIWATWCAPCIHEMPLLDTLQKNFDPAKLLVLPVSEDRSADIVENFYRAHHLSFPIMLDQAGRAPFVLHLRGLPTSLLIDPKGEEAGRIEGGLSGDMDKTIAALQGAINSN